MAARGDGNKRIMVVVTGSLKEGMNDVITRRMMHRGGGGILTG